MTGTGILFCIGWVIAIFVGLGVGVKFSRRSEPDYKSTLGHFVAGLVVLYGIGIAVAFVLWFVIVVTDGSMGLPIDLFSPDGFEALYVTSAIGMLTGFPAYCYAFYRGVLIVWAGGHHA